MSFDKIFDLTAGVYFQAVCDTPIARITGVCPHQGYRSATPLVQLQQCSYQGQQGDVRYHS